MAAELDMLRKAICLHVQAVLSLPHENNLKHFKSRMLDERDGGIVMEGAADQAQILERVIIGGKSCAVSFRYGGTKAAFAARVRCHIPSWNFGNGQIVSAILMDFPRDIKTTQRRASARVTVPDSCPLSLRVWRISQAADLGYEPPSTLEVPAMIRDLSLGGVGVTLVGSDDQPPQIAPNDRLRVRISYDTVVVILEGHVRQATKVGKPNELITGIVFQNHTAGAEGRKKCVQLNRILSELQREEMRAFRMGLVAA
jgi:c-di-GMP-binding flagellar brake protein YcgR